jgi:hypothetical protein
MNVRTFYLYLGLARLLLLLLYLVTGWTLLKMSAKQAHSPFIIAGAASS